VARVFASAGAAAISGTSVAIALFRGADRARGAVDMLERRGEPLDEVHRAFGREHGVRASHLLDLDDGFLHALNRGLRPPAEGVAAKARLELSFVRSDASHRTLSDSGSANASGRAGVMSGGCLAPSWPRNVTDVHARSATVCGRWNRMTSVLLPS
jgi:hypothetical protein